jgi:hypothetical protein
MRSNGGRRRIKKGKKQGAKGRKRLLWAFIEIKEGSVRYVAGRPFYVPAALAAGKCRRNAPNFPFLYPASKAAGTWQPEHPKNP